MAKRLAQSFVIAMVAAIEGCGGHESTTASPGRGGSSSGAGGQTLGNQNSSTGGRQSNGGRSQTGGSVAGGGSSKPAAGGDSSLGGTQGTVSTSGGSVAASGGSPTAGGAANTGGVRNGGGGGASASGHDGGNVSTGGLPPKGGASATGGKNTIGGGNATGGTIGSAGTNATTGGHVTGGNIGIAGASATGGKSDTGGASASAGTSPTLPRKFCGNITTGNQTDPTNSINANGLTFVKHWDQITPENAGKWGSVQSSATGTFQWSTLDAIYDYARQNGIPFKEYTLIWGPGNPSGSTGGTGVENWIKSFCERFSKVAIIDVVNEPPPHTTPGFAAALSVGETGSYPWITKSFKWARQYCGNAVLVLNDYNNVEYVDQQNHFIDIVKDIQAAGAPIDAVGVEAHAAYQMTASQLQTNLETLYAQTGLPIYITEYDVPKGADADQLEIYKAQFPIFWNASYVHGITIWGWILGRTWVTDSGLVDGTTPRPAMTWLMDYLGRPTPP
jgi:endo-1,4-beta-xylanase